MEIKDYLQKSLEFLNLELTDTQYNSFQKYYELLIEWNEKINLTAITKPDEVAVKHFADSLSICKFIKPNAKSIIDVGTGAGFPGIPLKIYKPDVNLTLLDSLNKRLVFLQTVCDELNISADIIHSRAEDGAKQPKLREKFDIATSRAVAKLNVLSEYCLPYVKIGGCFIAMKGPDTEQEINDAKQAIKILGGKIADVSQFKLTDNSSRTIVVIEKVKSSPKQYPRISAKIKSNPL